MAKNDYNYSYLGCSGHVSPVQEIPISNNRKEVSFNAFRQRCDLREWGRLRGFASTDTIEPHGQFFKSQVCGQRYYVMFLKEDGKYITHIWGL
jgi:hypothetical protein